MSTEINEGICLLSSIPVRREPLGKSEMVNQLLFGEFFLIQEIAKDWVYIICEYDGYEGWVARNQVSFLTKEYDWARNMSKIQIDPIRQIEISPGRHVHTQMGSNIPRENWEVPAFLPPTQYNVRMVANTYLNCPYMWGGRSLFGIDCSGFSQIVYKICGIKLLRDAYQQATQGKTVDFLDTAQPGDLAFFDNEDGNIIHTGIIHSKGKIIHAHGYVRIDPIDHLGIYNPERGEYSHRLRIIKRFMD